MKPLSGISRIRACRPVPTPQGARPAGREGSNHPGRRSRHALALALKTSKKACIRGRPDDFQEIVGLEDSWHSREEARYRFQNGEGEGGRHE